MPAYGPIKRSDLVRALQRAGWDGPYSGGKHEYMLNGDRRLAIPNPHGSDIGRQLLGRVLQEAGISRAEWERL